MWLSGSEEVVNIVDVTILERLSDEPDVSLKNDRLFQMLYLLLEKGSMTASELAGKLEISVRTIYRDVETLSMAGVPIYTSRLQSRVCR